MVDITIIERGNGGDLILRRNPAGLADLAVNTGIENMVYLAMFGGPVNGTWWANSLLLAGNPSQQFTSSTERVLKTVVLNSAGRIKIEQAVQADLEFLKTALPGITVAVGVRITNDDKVEININLDGQQLRYTWNPAEEFLTYQV